MLRLLGSSRYGLPVRQLAAQLGASVKTVRRDLDLLLIAGFPLSMTTQEHGRKVWRLESPGPTIDLCLSYDEALSLHVCRQLLEPWSGTPFWHSAKTAFRKIESYWGQVAAEYVERMRDQIAHVEIGRNDYSAKSDLIDALLLAIDESRSVRVVYHSLGAAEPNAYEIQPYGFIFHRAAIYLTALREPDGIRIWKLDRMITVEVTSNHFERSPAFDLQAFARQGFGVCHNGEPIPIRIWFSASVARQVGETVWHPTQMPIARPDGSLEITYRVAPTRELRRWIAGFGEHAVVLEPPELRAQIVRELHEALAAYKAARPRSEMRSRRHSKGKGHHAQLTGHRAPDLPLAQESVQKTRKAAPEGNGNL